MCRRALDRSSNDRGSETRRGKRSSGGAIVNVHSHIFWIHFSFSSTLKGVVVKSDFSS